MSSKSFATGALLLLLGVVAVSATQKNWVLIVAGAKDYNNYFSQSTACHAYQSVRKAGVPAENIIHMSYDDVAHSKENPFPGNLVVLPNGTNMYAGCKIDYKGHEVTPNAFLKIMQGDKAGVRELLGRDGPVIESGPDDHVFVTMVDHGGPGVFYFPGFVKLHAADLNQALKDMHTAKKFKKLVIYVESCESGSLFDGLLPKNVNIYASTCASPTEPGFMCCWDKVRKAYVGTYYANGWEFDTDDADLSQETLAQQYRVMKKACETVSHPQEYGDLSIQDMVLGQFQGNITSSGANKKKWFNGQLNDDQQNLAFAGIDLHNPAMDMVTLATLARRAIEATDSLETDRLKTELVKAMEIKGAAEDLVRDIVTSLVGPDTAEDVLVAKESLKNSVCYKDALETLARSCPGLDFGQFPFIRRNLQAIINLCNIKPLVEVRQGIQGVSKKHTRC